MIASLTERTEAEWHLAIDRHIILCLSTIASTAPGAEWHEDNRFMRLLTGMPSPFANMVCGARFDTLTADSDIAEALKPIKERGLPALWVAGPNSLPADLPVRLAAAGLTSASRMEAMAMELSAVADIDPQSAIQIEKVCDDTGLRLWIEVLAAGYDLPVNIAELFSNWSKRYGLGADSHIRAYVAYLDGKPAATSQLLLADGVAGVYSVATIPGARRKGLGSAVTSYALLDARRSGYKVGILQASEMGASVYRKIGFKGFGMIDAFVWMPKCE